MGPSPFCPLPDEYPNTSPVHDLYILLVLRVREDAWRSHKPLSSPKLPEISPGMACLPSLSATR